MILLGADVGTSSFDFASESLPAVALYTEGQDKMFLSESGTLTSQVVSSNQSCNVPLPPYAKSGTCSFATFTAQGSVVLSDFSLTGPSNKTLTIGIPSITLDGLWLAITEVQPVSVASVGKVSTRLLAGALSRVAGSQLPFSFTPERSPR